jgi:hypothetical protein
MLKTSHQSRNRERRLVLFFFSSKKKKKIRVKWVKRVCQKMLNPNSLISYRIFRSCQKLTVLDTLCLTYLSTVFKHALEHTSKNTMCQICSTISFEPSIKPVLHNALELSIYTHLLRFELYIEHISNKVVYFLA